MAPFFKFEGPSLPAPPTLPVFRVVLPHTEASGQGLFRRSVCKVCSKLVKGWGSIQNSCQRSLWMAPRRNKDLFRFHWIHCTPVRNQCLTNILKNVPFFQVKHPFLKGVTAQSGLSSDPPDFFFSNKYKYY